MKRNVLKTILGLVVALSLVLTGPTALASETETETELLLEGEAVEETEAEIEAAPDVEVKKDGASVITLKNEAGYAVKEAILKTTDSEEGETETEDETEASQAGNLVLTGEDGVDHTFENVDFSVMTDPVLVKDNGFLYIQYTNAEGDKKEAAETADEAELKEPVTMYVVNDVYIRAEANGDSEALDVASLGSEITVVAVCPKWYKVQKDDITGYVARAFLCKDKESADAAVKAEEAAVAQAQAAAAAAAAQAAAQAQQSAGQSSSQGVYEVSRQAYDDCDGSGHGYYEITYSDGSTAIEEY